MKTKTIKKHEEEYIHIKKAIFKRIGIYLIGMVFFILSYLNLLLIIYKWKELGLDLLFNCFENCNKFASFIQLDILNNILFEFVLVFLGILFLFNLFNKIDWKELITILITILIIGLIVGLIIGLIVGLIAGLIAGLITGLIAGLITGLIVGLNSGLIWGKK